MHEGRTMKDRERAERGATAITVAISLLVLMGFAALAMDGGLGFDDRRGTQNAADNAALAAAWEACNPSIPASDPETAALAVAAENGYDDMSADTNVTVTPLSASEYEVVIQTTNDATFARVGTGADTVSVTSRAIANCEEEPFLGGYAIFAGAEHCSNGGSVELNLSGSTKEVNGGIFSNGDLAIQGANTTINGEVEYRGTYNSNSGVPAEQYFGSPKEYPVDLEIADFHAGGSYRSDPNFIDAGGSRITNSWMITNGYATGNNSSITITESGIYYTSYTGNQDAIDLRGVSTDPGVEVTFVADGQIQVVGEASITGYAPITPGATTSLLMFSNAGSPPACNTNAIKFSGNDLTWTGLMFAPNGEIEMSASSNVAVNGSIIAHSVSVSGSNLQISWQDDPAADPRFVVELIQ